MIRIVGQSLVEKVLLSRGLGRRPHLQVIVDMTCLEKCGQFPGLPGLIRWFNGKRGLHGVVLYGVFGHWRIPWAFRYWRGTETRTPVQLA
ncbi:MAG: hypothetical protein OHK0012_06350 [Synechococcales cyanobacterium]